MDIGVNLPCYRRFLRAEELRTVAVAAEDMGYASVWVQDHLVAPVHATDVVPMATWPAGAAPAAEAAHALTPVHYYGEENWYLDPWVVWGFLCAATRRVKLGSQVVVAPYRHPVVQAKMLGTLDVLSNGRMLFGVGAGHVASEARALGMGPEAYRARGRMTDEYLRVIAALLSADEVTFTGEFVQFEAVRPLIRPVQQPHPPFFIGGNGRRAIDRAVALGQAWLPAGLTPAELRRAVPYLQETSSRAGRSVPPDVALTSSLRMADPRAPAASGRRPALSPDEAVAHMREYAAAGVGHLALDFPGPNLEVLLRQMQLFAHHVLPVTSTL